MMDGQKQRKDTDGNNVEIWEDVVNIKDLVLSLIISSITTLGGYLIGQEDPSRALIFGIVGAIVGFIICSVLFKPKRHFEYIDEEN